MRRSTNLELLPTREKTSPVFSVQPDAGKTVLSEDTNHHWRKFKKTTKAKGKKLSDKR